MAKAPEQEQGQPLPELPGHALGIFEQDYDRVGFTDAIAQAGFPNSEIMVFEGPDGQSLVRRMLDGFRWGESAEAFLKQAVSELERGHCVVSVAVSDARSAEQIARVAGRFGGRAVFHFGELIDVQLR